MKKIIVIGCPGSGKTTLSLRLHEALGVPLFHLDAIWHRADKTHITRDEFDTRLGELLEGESWIIDGNYSRTLERRIAACDTVILFDLPREVCLAGAVARIGQRRADMPWTDTELDPRLAEEIDGFAAKELVQIYALLEKYGGEKRVIIFKSREAAEVLLQELLNGKTTNTKENTL